MALWQQRRRRRRRLCSASSKTPFISLAPLRLLQQVVTTPVERNCFLFSERRTRSHWTAARRLLTQFAIATQKEGKSKNSCHFPAERSNLGVGSAGLKGEKFSAGDPRSQFTAQYTIEFLLPRPLWWSSAVGGGHLSARRRWREKRLTEGASNWVTLQWLGLLVSFKVSQWTDSPVNSQLQVRNTDVIFSTVQQNLSLRNKQQLKSHDGQ